MLRYGIEAWTIPQSNELALLSFEKKGVCKILCPLRVDHDYSIRTKDEMKDLHFSAKKHPAAALAQSCCETG